MNFHQQLAQLRQRAAEAETAAMQELPAQLTENSLLDEEMAKRLAETIRADPERAEELTEALRENQIELRQLYEDGFLARSPEPREAADRQRELLAALFDDSFTSRRHFEWYQDLRRRLPEEDSTGYTDWALELVRRNAERAPEQCVREGIWVLVT